MEVRVRRLVPGRRTCLGLALLGMVWIRLRCGLIADLGELPDWLPGWISGLIEADPGGGTSAARRWTGSTRFPGSARPDPAREPRGRAS